MEFNIWDAFEQLDASERDEMPGTEKLETLRIDPSELDVTTVSYSIDISHPRIGEMLSEHNNKVGSLMITYTLAFHYYNKGIPDDQWFISPGKNGQSVQYMPNFATEHWGRLFWFSYFADSYYLKIMSLWDSLLEILNHYYGYNFTIDLRLRSNVMAKLKTEHKPVYDILIGMLSDPLYTQAQVYRTAAAHGTSPSTVTNTVTFEKDVDCEVFDKVENGKAVMKTVRGTRITHRVGDYTKVYDIAKHMNEFAEYCGGKIHEIISTMKT